MAAQLMLALWLLVPVAESVDNGLFGLANYLTQSFVLSRFYDNASHVPIGSEYLDDLVTDGLSDLDAATATYYYLDQRWNTSINNWQIRHTGASIATGQVTSTCPVPFPETEPIGSGQLMAWDSDNNRLIAGGPLNPGGNNSYGIGYIDPNTCAWNQIAVFDLPSVLSNQGAVAYCPTSKTLFMELGDESLQLWSVNMVTGAVASKALPDQCNGLQTLDYDPVTGKLYGIGLIPHGGQNVSRAIVSLDCVSQDVSIVGAVPGYTTQYGAVATLDVASRGLYWIGQEANASDYDPFYLIKNSIVDGSVLSADLGGGEPQKAAQALLAAVVKAYEQIDVAVLNAGVYIEMPVLAGLGGSMRGEAALAAALACAPSRAGQEYTFSSRNFD